MPCRQCMNRPLPLKSTSPSFVIMAPSTSHFGQKTCFIRPHGFSGSVPKLLVPFVPAWNPGAALLTFMFTSAFSSVADLMPYEVPSGDSSIEQLSAKKEYFSSSNSYSSKGLDDQSAGFDWLGYRILLLNWQVVRMPLSRNHQLSMGPAGAT